MRLVVVTALWQRPHVSAIMLDSLAAQKARGFDLHVVAVSSEGSRSRELASSRGAHYVESANKPLGRKWQRALLAARDHKPADAVLVLGSDNIVNDALLRRWTTLLEEYDYVGALDAYQFNPAAWSFVHWDGYVGERAGEPIGSSRCFRADLLDRFDWRIWAESYNRGLDWSTTCRLRDIPHHPHLLRMSDSDVRHLGIKLKGAMSPSLHKTRVVEPLDPLLLLEWFGTDIGGRILELGYAADLEAGLLVESEED